MSQRARTAIAVALVVIGSLSLTLSLAVGWAQRSVFDDKDFAARAVSMLDSAAVRQALAQELTNEIIQKGSSSLASYRTPLVGVVEDVMTTEGFRSIFRRAIEQAHRAVFQRNGAVALLELGETLKLVSQNSRNSAGLSSSLPSAAGSLLIDVTPTVRRLELWRFSNDVRWLDEAAMLVTVAAFAGAIALDRRRGIVELVGIGVAASGIAIALAAEVIPDIAVTTINDPSEASAIHAGAGRFVADLKALGLWTIPIGILLAAAAEASARTDRIRVAVCVEWLRRHPYSELARRTQLAVGAGVLIAGVLILLNRNRIVPFLVLLAGCFIVYRGAVLLIRALLGPEPEPAPARRPAWSRRVLLGTAAGVVMVLLIGALIVNVTAASSSAREDSVLVCNGSSALCDRRLDHVAFAGSHNSMSAESDPGWLFAENLTGIPAQLQYGIRALLLKSHYGIDSGIKIAGVPLVVTDKAAEIHNDKDTEALELGTEAVKTVEDIQRTVGPVSGTPQLYLCHGYCELGATKFSDTLNAVRGFMDRNPHEVLIMIIGDYVTPEDTEKAFRRAGLIKRLWTYDHDRKPPTLREMIRQRRTLYVLSEHAGGTPAWYNPAYITPTSDFQDTPYAFAEPSEFSCARNRGPVDAPLFQINHWITNTSPPNPTQAKSINSSRTLMARVENCREVRGRFPTVIGVNFYDRGDLLKVVEHLNETGKLVELAPPTK